MLCGNLQQVDRRADLGPKPADEDPHSISSAAAGECSKHVTSSEPVAAKMEASVGVEFGLMSPRIRQLQVRGSVGWGGRLGISAAVWGREACLQ